MTVRIRVAIEAAAMILVGALVWWGLGWRVVGGLAATLGALLLFGAAISSAFAAGAQRGKDRLVAAVGLVLTWSLLTPLFLVGFSLGHLILRLTGKDPLRREFPCRAPSCWLPRPPPPSPASYRHLY